MIVWLINKVEAYQERMKVIDEMLVDVPEEDRNCYRNIAKKLYRIERDIDRLKNPKSQVLHTTL